MSMSRDERSIFGTAILNLVAGDKVSPFNCMMQIKVVNLESDTFGNPIFQKVLQISHPPRLQVSRDALPSFAALSQSA